MANVVNDRDVTLLSTSPRTISTSVTIGADAASFLRGKNGGTITPSSITLTANLAPAEFATPTPTIVWHYAVSSTPDTWVPLAGSTLTKVIANSDSFVTSLLPGEHLTFRAVASKAGYRTTEPAYFEVSYSEAPGEAPIVLLSRTATNVQANSLGEVTVFSNTGTTITVRRGESLLTYGASGANTFSVGTPIIDPAGKVTLDAAPVNGVFGNITAMASDTDSVIVTYPVTIRDAQGLNPIVINGIQTFTKVRAGAGVSVTANLTQDFIGIPTDSVGNGAVYTNASTTMQVYVNGILQTAGWTYTVFALSNVSYRDANDVSDQTDTGTGAVIDPFPVSITSLTADTGSLTITATDGNIVITKTLNVVKNKGGVSGTTVTWYKISPSAPVIYKSSPDVSTDGAHTPITFTPQKIVGDALPVLATNVYYTATAGNAAEAGTATLVTMAVTPTITNSADIDKYTFKIYNDASKTTLLDSEIIPVVFRGANGSNGVSPPLITLTANGIAFTGASPGATTVFGDTINITATIANSVESPSFSAHAYNSAGTDLGTITLGDVGGIRTLTAAQFTNSGTWATRKVVVTATLSTVSDTYTIYRVDNGGSAVQGALVNSSHTLPAYNNGTVSSYTGSGSVIRVAEGNTELQFTTGAPAAGQWAATRAQLTGTISPGSITLSGLTGVMADHSGMNTDTAVVRVTITGKTLAGVDFPAILLDQTLTKSKQGTEGISGDSSRRAYALFSGNPASVAWDAGSSLTVSGDTLPGVSTVSNPNAATAWTSTIQNPASGQAMFQSDGIYNGTNTVWQSPYLSNLKVGNLAAISANMGTVEIATSGSVWSGKTSSTDTANAGFFLGNESNVTKFFIGNGGDTKSLKWDGTNLTIKGTITGSTITGSSIYTASSPNARIEIGTSGNWIKGFDSSNSQKFLLDMDSALMNYSGSGPVLPLVTFTQSGVAEALFCTNTSVTTGSKAIKATVVNNYGTAVHATAALAGTGVYGTSATGYGVHGYMTSTGIGVYGECTGGGTGVRGVSNTGYGVMGTSTSGYGGSFSSISSDGVINSNKASGAPITVTSTAMCTNLNANYLQGNTWASPGTIGGGTPGAVIATSITGTVGEAVGILGTSNSGNGVGVKGMAGNAGTGVRGECSGTGFGVAGSSTSGWGGVFSSLKSDTTMEAASGLVTAGSLRINQTPVNNGTATATFVSTTKPGANTSNLWLSINLNGTTYYIPVWA